METDKDLFPEPEDPADGPESTGQTETEAVSLDDIDRQILQLSAAGYRYREIEKELEAEGITVYVIEKRMAKVRRLFGTDNNFEAIVRAAAAGEITFSDEDREKLRLANPHAARKPSTGALARSNQREQDLIDQSPLAGGLAEKYRRRTDDHKRLMWEPDFEDRVGRIVEQIAEAGYSLDSVFDIRN